MNRIGQFQLGERVLILNSGEDDGIGGVRGTITEHTRFLDGSERYGITHWHGGEKRVVTCEARELSRLESPVGNN